MNLLPVSWRNRLEDLRDQVQSVVTRWVPRMRRGGRRSSETWMPTRVFAAGPNIDVEESPDEIIVRAELPGLNRDEFTVDASPDALFIRGEKKYQRESRSFGFHRFECAQGRFIRAVPLPCEVRADQADARFRRGILTVRLPKTEAARRRRVHIHIN